MNSTFSFPDGVVRLARWIHLPLICAAWIGLMALGAMPRVAAAQSVSVGMGTPSTLTAAVVPGDTMVELPFSLTAVTRLRLDAIVPVNGATVSLIDPAGVTVIAAGDSRTIFNPGHLLNPPRPGGVFELPEVLAPRDGVWRLRVMFAPAIERTGILVTVLAASRYQVGVVIDRDLLFVGEDAAMGVAVLDNGAPVLGLAPSISITRVGAAGAAVTKVARDDGTGPDGRANDGVYSIENVFSVVGEYDITASVSINTANGPVLRTAVQRIRVDTPAMQPPVVTLSNVLGAGACVNGLQVKLDLNTLRSGSYVMLVRLMGRNGETLDVRRALNLAQGPSTATALFSAQEIKAAIPSDGPYAVSLIDFLDVGGDDFTLAYRRRDVGSFNVSRASFCTLPIELPGPLTVTPVLKGNFIGSLNFSFPVQVSVSGSYQISFKVISANGTDLGLLNASRSLAAGLNMVTVNLASDAYLSNDGPYQAISLLVLSGSNSATQSTLGSSAAFSRWQFAPPVTGDLNNDGSVDAADNAILSTYRSIPALSPGDRRDLNRDGVIDLRDARELQRLACKAPNCPLNP